MRWFILLSCLIGLLVWGGLTARPVVAETRGAIVIGHGQLLPFRSDATTYNPAANAELTRRYSNKMAEVAGRLDDWKCVREVFLERDSSIRLDFFVSGPTENPLDNPIFTLELRLRVEGQGTKTTGQLRFDASDPELAQLTQDYYDLGNSPSLLQAIAAFGEVHIEQLMKQFKPCAAKAKVKTTMKFHLDDRFTIIDGEATMAPVELELVLNENGAFVAQGPAVWRLTGTIAPGPAILALRGQMPPPPPCTFETVQVSTQQPYTLRMTGAYRDTDASLVYDSITFSETGPIMTMVTGGCVADLVPPEIPVGGEGDNLASGALAQPLEDGAVLALPRPTGLPEAVTWQWEGSVELTYRAEDGAAPAMAFIPAERAE